MTSFPALWAREVPLPLAARTLVANARVGLPRPSRATRREVLPRPSTVASQLQDPPQVVQKALEPLRVCSHFSCSQRARGALHVGLKVRWPSHENARVMRSCSRDRGACTCRSDVSRGVCHCLRGGRRVGPFGTADPPCRSDGTPDPLPSSRTRSSTGFGRWRTQSGRSTDRRACQL